MKTKRILVILSVAIGLVGSTSAALPEGWDEADLGRAGGSASYDPLSDTWTVSCAWYSTHYVFRSLKGDGKIVALILSTGSFSSTEVVIREDLTDSSGLASVCISTIGQYRYSAHFAYHRPDIGYDASGSSQIDDIPYWVMLERTGDTFTGYISSNGISWTLIGSEQISMSTYVLVGMSVGVTQRFGATAEFDSVKVESGTGGWIIYDDNMYTTISGNVGIGTTSPGKELEVICKSIGGGIKVYGDASTGTLDSPAFHLNGKDILGNDRAEGLGLALGDGHFSSNAAKGDLVLRAQDASIHFSTQYPVYPAKMTIKSNGKVGIGTSEPDYELDVKGDVQARAYHTGDIFFQKDDEKLWRMFEDQDGLYLENLNTRKVYSFVLQETENRPEAEGIVSFDQAIKDLHAENDFLKRRLAALEKIVQEQIVAAARKAQK